MSPFSRGERRPAAGREPPLAPAAAGRGMMSRKVGKLLFPVLSVIVCSSAADGFNASFVVSYSWIEIKGHKGLKGVDENWV